MLNRIDLNILATSIVVCAETINTEDAVPRWKTATALWIIALSLIVTAIAARARHVSVESVAPAALAATDTAQPCAVQFSGRALPDEVRETSGLARGIDRPDLLWTHNDAGHEAVLFAVDVDGQMRERVAVRGAASVDWEDIESGPCDGGNCLYIGDIGDNDAERNAITVYRIPEPAAGATEAQAQALTASYPDGAQDAEGLFLHDGRLYVVTKGRNAARKLYRFPGGGSGALEAVATLGPEPGDLDRLTAATAVPGGEWIAIRSYRTLFLYPAADLTAGRVDSAIPIDLAPLGESQGEGIVFAADGTAYFSSEAENRGSPVLSAMRCELPTG